MKKIYILTAIFALLTLSLNAQQQIETKTTAQAGKVEIKPDGYFRMGPSRASTTPVTPPYSNGFDSSDETDWWEVINNNNDNYTWNFNSGYAQIRWNSSLAADDWLVTAPLRLKAGKTYKFYIEVWSGASYTETIEVKLASTNTATALSSGTSIIGQTSVNSSTHRTLSNENVTVSADGDYYIGIHCCSAADRYYLYVDNFVIDTDITDPTIQVDENTVNMNSIPGTTVTETVTVTGLNLTGGITATVGGQDASLFGVSPASLGNTGGELTISYTPTATGTHTATITLSSTGADPVTITVNGTSSEDLTICDGTAENYHLPIYGNYAEELQINQMIYPEITSLIGKNITSMTFYSYSTISSNLGDDNWVVKLGTTNQTAYTSGPNASTRLVPADIQEVYSGYLTTGSNTLTITFDTPFTYTGGNLLVDFEETTTTGNYASTRFYGQSQSAYTGFYSLSNFNDGNLEAFLPKVTFTFEINTTPKVTISPEELTISDSGTNNTFEVESRNIPEGHNLGVNHTNSEFGLTLTATNGVVQSWGFEQNNGSVDGNIAVTYNGRALTATDEITAATEGASKTVTVTYVPDLYIVTDYGHNSDNGYSNNGWDFANGTAMTNNNGIYTATFTADLPNTYIVFARKLGESNPWNTRYLLGPSSDGNWWLPTDGNGNGSIDVNNSNCIKIQGVGSYTVTINANDYTFTITKLVPDLAIALSAPASAVGGNTATVTATVTNTGDLPVTGYTVTITADGNTILTQTVNETLAVGASATFNADYATTEAQIGSTVSLAANVACTDDGDASNNNATASMTIVNMPPPENVVATGDSENQSATVTWDAPSNLPIGTGPVTEKFEDTSVFPQFTTGGIDADQHYGNFGDWTLYDATGGCRVWGSTELNYNNENNPHAWFVFNPSGVTAASGYEGSTAPAAHSGEQYLESICPLTSSTAAGLADHWLISPELSGNAQTITWWYSVVTTKYVPETYEVWVSSTDNTAPGSFSKYAEYSISNSTWAQQSLQLPAGTKYFAIRHTSNDQFGMMVDDIKYEANDVPIAPESYNIYLDGVLVGNVDANDPLTYDFSNVSGGEHTASVSAVYPGNVESALVSDTFTIQAKTPTPTIEYEVTNGTVVITATGEGHVTLVVDGITYEGEGSVSVTVVRSPEDRIVTATATAQQEGALESNPASQDVTIPALNTTPTNPASGLLRLHLLIVDQMKEPIPADNSHPDKYGYVLRYEPNGPQGEGVKESATVKVDIQKADCEVTGYYSLKQIDGDTIIGLDHKQGITMDVVTADVAYDLSDSNDILYEYLLQGAKNRVPEYQQDYLTKLRKTQNFTYVEMLEGDDKGHEYPNGEHHYLGALELGTYGSTFMSYAPSVSTWGIQRRYFEDDGYDNTYGAPIWRSAVGQVKMSTEEAPIAERQVNQWNSVNWEDQGGPASLYILDNIWATAKLPHSQIATVKYEPYMFRVFVESKNGLLRPYEVVEQGEGTYDGEHLVPVDRELTEYDMKGPKCVWSGYLQFDEETGEVIGDLPNGVEVQIGEEEGQKTYTYHKSKVDRDGGSNAALPQPSEWDKDANNAMFGALDALAIDGYNEQGKPIYHQITSDDLNVFVRFYYVVEGMADGWVPNSRGQGDDPAGYGSESPGSTPSPWTAVKEIAYHGEIVSQTYYNIQGMTSDKPFDGVNIVVTRYSDGATVVSKVIR